jgi:hypothetical protein
MNCELMFVHGHLFEVRSYNEYRQIMINNVSGVA